MSKLKIGWSTRDITVDKITDMPGHLLFHLSTGVYDHLYTTALVVEDGQEIVIFLSIDGMEMMTFLLDEIRAKVMEKNPEIPVMKILANTTHAHTGPSHAHDYGGTVNKERLKKLGYTQEQLDLAEAQAEYISLLKYVDTGDVKVEGGDAYREFLSDQASDAICEAYESRAEGGIAYGYGYAVVAHSRRTCYFDDLSKRPGVELNALTALHGHAKMYGEPNDEMFSHYEAGADHFINIMYTFDEQEKLTGAVVNIPCPSQNTESLDFVTADYWADIRAMIHKKYGEIPILAQCAAAGDLSPRILHYKKAQERRFRLKYGDLYNDSLNERMNTELNARRDIAERVAWAFDEVLDWAKEDIKRDVPLKHRVENVELTRRWITDEEYETALREIDAYMKQEPVVDAEDPIKRAQQKSGPAASANRFRTLVLRYEDQKTNPKFSTEIHVIRIGDIAFASNQFELYMDYQHRIQARSPFEQTFIVQLAGQPLKGAASYICTERAREGRGYSASMFCNKVSCEGGQELVEMTLEYLRELAKD